MEIKLTPVEKKKAALNDWMDTFGTELLRMCCLYLKDLQLAEDVTQETFLRAYREYDHFRGDSSVKTWLVRIAINLCKDQKKSAWMKRVDLAIPLEEGGTAHMEEDWEQKIRSASLLRQITSLPLKYREVILLYYYQEYKIKEIAKIINVSENTVSTRLMRAKAQLRKKLKGRWEFEERD